MVSSMRLARWLHLFAGILLLLNFLPVRQVRAQANGVSAPYRGMWISADELARLPMAGTAWEALLNAANQPLGVPNLQDQSSDQDIYTLAKALVYARTGDMRYRAEVVAALQAVMETENGGRTLGLGRNLVSYVIAADLVNLPQDAAIDGVFRGWLRGVVNEMLDGRSLVSTHEERPNNWGTHAGASRVAVALYLGDTADLDRAAKVFNGWLGDRSAYAGFTYGEMDWQCNSSSPVGINPKGCTRNGVNIDGAQPEEMRRGGVFQNPPAYTDYAWDALEGAIVQAALLDRAGYPVFEWQDRALLRAYQYLYRIGWQPQRNDIWQVWLLNNAYSTSFATGSCVGHGKNMAWTEWTHMYPVLRAAPAPDAAALASAGPYRMFLPSVIRIDPPVKPSRSC